MAALDQSVKSSEHKLSALHAAKDSAEAEQAANAKLAHSLEHEQYMIELMNDASREVAAKFLQNFFLFSLCLVLMVPSYSEGSFHDAQAEEERINRRVEALTRL